MSSSTYSGFTYGHTVTEANRYIDFDEGSGELTGLIAVGSYTLGDYIGAVATALNNAGTQEYAVSLDRTTRTLTITAGASFDLLVTTGTNVSLSAYPLMGYTVNQSGTSLEGDSASGSLYEPQGPLQRYVDFADNVRTTNGIVRETATGRVEVVSYSTVEFMECNITPITNRELQGGSFKNDPQALENFREFMRYCITKAPIELILDLDTPTTFRSCLLESTRESGDGLNFKSKEWFQRKVIDYYQSGTLTFRGL